MLLHDSEHEYRSRAGEERGGGVNRYSMRHNTDNVVFSQ